MTYERCPYVREVMGWLSVRNSQLRGIISPAETKRLCVRIRELLAGSQVTPAERDRLREYTQLLRCFTVAEAENIASIHSVYNTLARRKSRCESAKR
jgi:hypothetical protein